MYVTAVIPAYKEAANVVELTDRLVEAFDRQGIDRTIRYVYQGTDGGARQLEEMDYDCLEVDHYPDPLGVGRGYRIGFQDLPPETTHVLTMDADLNHRPEELSRFLNAREDGDIIIGSRFVDGGEFDDLDSWRKFASPFAAAVISRLFGVDANDVSSGYRLYDVDVVRDICDRLEFDDFDFYPEALVRARREGYTTTEVPITYEPRKHGESKMNELETALDYGKLLVSMKSPL